MSVSLLLQLFATAGNTPKGTPKGFTCGHEPVHESKSGTCVLIEAARDVWHCTSCLAGGGPLQAVMSLRGLSPEDAKAYLRDKLNAESGDTDHARESQANQLTGIAKEFPLFHDEYRDAFAVLPVNSHSEIMKCRGKLFKQFLRYKFFTEYGKAPGSEAIQAALGVIEGLAVFAGECRTLHNRVAWHDGAIWYDLTDADWRAVRITDQGWEIVAAPPILFRRYSHQEPQVSPEPGGTLSLLDRYILVTDDSRKLLKATIGTFLIPDIPHAGLHTYGGQGAGKSFVLWAVRKIVDPSFVPLLSLPDSKAELSQQLAHHYAPFYDNLSVLQKWVSEALCRAVTGDGFTKREFYTDDDDVIYKFRRCIGLNGINIAATEPDILDRLVLIEMQRIKAKTRKEDLQLRAEFIRDQPKLLGALFDAVSGAMTIKPLIRLRNLPRMADYMSWGEALSQAMGEEPGTFFALYTANISRQHEEVVKGHAVAAAIAALMEEREKWIGSPTELLGELVQIAEKLKLDVKDKAWPKAPHALTRRLKEVESNLRESGVSVKFSEDEKKHTRVAIERQEEKAGEAGEPDDANEYEDLGAENATGSDSQKPGKPDEKPGDSSQSEDDSFAAEEASDADSPAIDPASPAFDSDSREENDFVNQEVPGSPAIPAIFRSLATEGGIASDPIIEITASDEMPLFTYLSNASQLEPVLPELLAASVIGIDTETTGLDPLKDHLRLIQIATPHQTVVIDAVACPVQLLAPLFSQPRLIIGHNLKFDVKFLVAAGLPWPTGNVFDTMIVAQLLASNPRNCGLAAVASRYLGITVDKAEQAGKWSGELTHQQLVYAAKDAQVLLPLADRLQEELTQAGLTQIAEIENRCLLALAWMELAGLPIERDQWLARAAEETHRAQALHAHLAALIGQPHTNGNGNGLHLSADPSVNWNSPDQVLEVFRARGHTLSNTTSQSLHALIGKDLLAELLLDYREAKKRASTYGAAWIKDHLHSVTGRVHADYFQLGSAAGRMSCTNPNVQNLPRSGDYRRTVCPGEGRAIVKADFSQIELRIAAVLADDHNMLAAFRAGEDLHKLTAAKVLGIALDQVGKEHRQLAKALNFGLLYGMGARALQTYAATNYRVTLTEAQAKAHRERFFSAYPGLARWHAQTGALLDDEKELETRTMANRRRVGISKFTVALNTPVQGTGADGLKLALARLYEHQAEVTDVHLIACIHDEIVAECPQEVAEQTAAWLQHHMTAAMSEIIGASVPVEVETTVGRDWSGTELNPHHTKGANDTRKHAHSQMASATLDR